MFFSLVVDLATTTRSNEQVFTNIIDTIVSPNYPDDYGNRENRRYRIEAPTKKEIVLIFNSFNVEHTGNCAYDSLSASARTFVYCYKSI